MPTYITRKPHKGDKKYNPGDKRTCSKRTGEQLIDKGLVFPNYVTKEDKNAYNANNKAYISPIKDKNGNDSGWFDVKRQGESIVDRKYRKKEAIKKRDEINGS